MSPSVGNFVHDLVEMAKAMEELPLVQAELSRARKLADDQGATIAAREESILKLKAEIESLQSKVREAEVSRDDAELRFLELDEKAGKVLRLLGSVSGSLEAATSELKPKPEPVPEPTPAPAPEGRSEPQAEWAAKPLDPEMPVPQGQSEPSPTAPSTEAQSAPTAPPSEPVATGLTPQTSGGTPGEGQSATDPTPASATITNDSPTASSGISDGATAQPETPSLDRSVGYHNEPSPHYTSEWYDWARQMDERYGVGWWPARSVA